MKKLMATLGVVLVGCALAFVWRAPPQKDTVTVTRGAVDTETVEATSPLVLCGSPDVLEAGEVNEATNENALFGAASTVAYRYQLAQGDAPDKMRLDLEFDVISGDATRSFQMSGEVASIITTQEDEALLAGALYKNFVIDGVTYNFAVGFRKLASSDAISVGLVATPLEGQEQSCYRFGTLTLSPELYAALQDVEQAETVQPTDTAASYFLKDSELNYAFVGDGASYLLPANPLKDSMTGLQGASMQVYRENRNGRFLVLARSRCSAFTTSTLKNTSNQLLGAYVDSVEVSIERTGDAGRLQGMEESELSIRFPDKTTQGWGVGSLCIFRAEGLGLEGQLNFDDTPIPLVFQVAFANKSGAFEGVAHMDLTYVIETSEAAFYVKTTQAECPVTMPAVPPEDAQP